MVTTTTSNDNEETSSNPRQFRLWLYLLIITVLSWPFLFLASLVNFNVPGGGSPWSQTMLGAIGMLMITVGTFIAGRWVFRDGFDTIGWRWGSKRSWMVAIGLILLIFIVPSVLDILFGPRTMAPFTWNMVTLTLCVLFLGPIFGFGEEFGFRGYLLPRLWWLGSRKALVVLAVIYWAWHLPVVLPTMLTYQSSLLQIIPTLLIALLVTGCSAIILSYVWVRSGSIVVASVFHGLFDAARNIMTYYLFQDASPLILFSYSIIIVIIGLLMLWRVKWVLPEPLRLCTVPVPIDESEKK